MIWYTLYDHFEKQNTNKGEIDQGIAEIIKAINRYHQEVTITKVTGECPYGHKEGEKYRVTVSNSDGLCGSLFQAICLLVVLYTKVYQNYPLWLQKGVEMEQIISYNPEKVEMFSWLTHFLANFLHFQCQWESGLVW